MNKYTIVLILVTNIYNVIAQSGEIKVLNDVSVPSDFPFIEVSILEETAPGKIFIANRRGSPYMMILENDGTPYFYKRLSRRTLDFKLQPTGTLTRWHDNPVYNFVELDSNYNEIDTLYCSPDYHIDNHEIQLLPNGNYLVIVIDWQTRDMGQVVEGGQENATLKGNIIQELDRNGNVLFEWSSWDHFDVLDAVNVDLTANTIDYVHMNSIAVDYDGHLLISSRHLSEITKINRQNREIIWRLGGKNNQFQFINDEYGFSYQHDIRPVPGKPNQYTLFDNGNHRTPVFSRAIELQLDTLNWTATKVWEYRHNPDRYAPIWGNVQRLPNGNTLINWSVNDLPIATEVTAEGDIVYEMNFSNSAECYRTFRYEWESSVNIPYLIAESHSDKVTLIFNKFGDKSVKEYHVYGGKNPKSDELIINTSEPFTHLSELDNYQTYYFRVTAVDSNGVESDFSNEEEVYVKFIEPGENLILNGDFSQHSEYWELEVSDDASAQGFVEERIYHIQIDTSGISYSDVQLLQNNLEIIESRQYVLEFDAWSSEPKFFDVRVRKSTDPYTDYSKIGAVYSTTNQQQYSYEFNMDNITDYSAQIVFECGQSTADLYIDDVSLTFKEEETKIESYPNLPTDYKLFANYPNPFNPVTIIEYSIPELSHVRIMVYNLLGELVQTLIDLPRNPGVYQLSFDASDLSSGIYFYNMNARAVNSQHNFHQVNKMIVLK